MLEVSTEPETLECSPHYHLVSNRIETSLEEENLGALTEPLVHSIGMLGPRLEFILDKRELLRIRGNVSRVFIKQNLFIRKIACQHAIINNWEHGESHTVPYAALNPSIFGFV